jgi:hypothetical protein
MPAGIASNPNSNSHSEWINKRGPVTGLVTAAACLVLAGTQFVTLGRSDGHRVRTTGRPNPPVMSVPPSSVPVTTPTSILPSTPVFRFHQDTDSCSPQPTPPINRTWQVSAPRTTQVGVASVVIGLRNKMAGSMGDRGPIDPQIMLPAPDIALWAQVMTPDGVRYTLDERATPPEATR